MNPFRQFLQKYSLPAGITLMFLLTWPIDLANSGILPVKVPFPVYITLGWGFIYASLIVTGLALGKDAVVALLKRFLIWRVGWKWFLTAALFYPAVFVIAILINATLTHSAIDFSSVMAHKIFGAAASLPVYVLPYFIFDLLTNGEEMGWRGFVLPRLQAKHGALVSSLILGVIWGFWHLPKFLAPGNPGLFWFFMVKVIADAVIYTWLYNNTGGSLLMTAILHSAGNAAGAFLPIANTQSGENLGAYFIMLALIVLAAAAIAIVTAPQALSRNGAKQVQE